MTRSPRLLLRFLLLLVVLAALATLAVWWAMRGSLAQLDGELSIPGLSAPVQIERDALGTVTIHAANQADAARALGYVHGQERFFEMDLLRRSAAGELAALFGPIAVDRDKAIRVHRMRARVKANLGLIVGRDLPVLKAYAYGVNLGLASLKTRPWPYLLLRADPQQWQLADTPLAGYAMFFDLQDENNSRELALLRIKGVIPPELYRLIDADGTEWDAPLVGAPRGNIALPGAAEVDLRTLPMPTTTTASAQAEPAAPGSNNFAVAGPLTADGRAIVANDMHLTLRAPNLWFRARLVYDDALAPDGKVDISGFTLPGIPAVIVGSNRHVAWGFTNSYGDWADWFRVTRPTHVVHPEIIEVKGEASVTLRVEEEADGPVLHHDKDGTPLALFWMAHAPGSLNLQLGDMARAGNVTDAVAIAHRVGIPEQNLMVADSAGDIAWTLAGRIPDRGRACDSKAIFAQRSATNRGSLSSAPAKASCHWAAVDAPSRLATAPSIVRPPGNRLWTANARVLDGEALRLVGDAGYANGARAKQIRDDLYARDRFDERQLMAIQLDDRALFLQRWWKLLRELSAGGNDPAWKAIQSASRKWEGRAGTGSTSYRLVREWRLAVLERIKQGLMAPAVAKLGKDFVMPDLPQIEGVAWQLVSQRPAHLLPRRYTNWDALFLDAAREVVAKVGTNGSLAGRNWGERNTAAICHPLAKALPALLRPLLCMAREPLAGDINMPRVVAPDFGASERMVVSPGHEEDGIIHMPGGQSGNPLSPFWGAGHEAWVHGRPTPFLPGKAMHRLTLRPD